MSEEIKIPQASAARLRAAYAQFTQTAELVAEALGIPASERYLLDLERGAFVKQEGDAPNGVVEPAGLVAAR